MLNHKGFLIFFCSFPIPVRLHTPLREVLGHYSMHKQGREGKTFEVSIYQLERRKSGSFGAKSKNEAIFEPNQVILFDCDQRGVS
jgi:hypothetical protein